MLQRKILYVILQTWKYNSVEVEKCCAELTLMQKIKNNQPKQNSIVSQYYSSLLESTTECEHLPLDDVVLFQNFKTN